MIRRVTNFIEDWSLPALVGFTMLAPARGTGGSSGDSVRSSSAKLTLVYFAACSCPTRR